MRFKRIILSWHYKFICGRCFVSSASKSDAAIRIAVVGSGPAGFYFTQSLLKRWPGWLTPCSVDMFEKLPAPYGLVRCGVAPDHPEVKNCINQFEKVANEHSADKRFRFYGNVTIGRDVTVRELAENYHAVLLAYGSSSEKHLNLPGQDAKNCVSARTFVGWYNGGGIDPAMFNDKRVVDLKTLHNDTAVVLGHGNVALDVARMLLMSPDALTKTDICQRALEQIRHSPIRKVVVVGRRGPLQASFTIAELREMTKLPGCTPHFADSDFRSIELDPNIMEKLDRPRRRITQLMIDTCKLKNSDSDSNQKSWYLKFLRSPVEILKSNTNNSVCGIHLGVNTLQYYENLFDHKSAKAVRDPSCALETVECGLVVYSVGYKTVNIDETYLPFDEHKNVLKVSADGFCKIDGLSNVYGCGWCVTGPKGVIATTQSFAKNSADQVCQDASQGALPDLNREKLGFLAVEAFLRKRNVKWVDWDDWRRIDDFETAQGAKVGKPREKLINLTDFLALTKDK